MRNNLLKSFIVLAIIIFLSCSNNQETTDILGLSTDLLSDIYEYDSGILEDAQSGLKNIKISIRSNFINSHSNKVIILFYKDTDKIIPDEYTDEIEWEIEKTISLSLKADEGILAYVDNDNSKSLNAGDYFTKMDSQDISDGGKYILFINSYIPFERGGDQGLNGNEIQVFNRIKNLLFESEGLSMVITKIGDDYKVFSRRGEISFKRILTENGYEYPVQVISGENPFGNTDEKALYTFEGEIKAGSNPKNTQYTSQGYKTDDERISFIEEDKTSYPYAYERISQLFDDPNSGDIIGLAMPYGDGLYEVGAHGHLDITQSRAPLIFSGSGVKKGSIYEWNVKAVDIAPTVLKALGCKSIIGVNKNNQLSKENYLRRQDGNVIEDILSGEIAEYAIIIVLDGLSHTELTRAISDQEYDIPNIRALATNGVYFKYGHITNYFSVTIPSHTSIATGLYAGHHGIVNNLYYLRETGKVLTLIDLGVGPAQYLRAEAETIFEAYHRNYGKYDEKKNKNGKFSASINEPATRGATYATLESLIYNFSSYKYDELPTIDALKQVTSADNTAINQMIYLFTKGELPIPSLVMINLTTTDSAGHGWGPHSDIMKEVLSQTDFRIGKILELYKNAGILDKTLFVLTADHGMEIQDRNRSFEYRIDGANVSVPLLDNNNIRYTGGLPFMYFDTMGYEIDGELSTTNQQYNFYVYDEDRKFPIKGATVRIEQDNNIGECVTDELGKCSLNITFIVGDANLKIEHQSYNFIEEKISIIK